MSTPLGMIPVYGPADNTPITPGSGQVIRTDDVGGVKYQVVKLDVGGPGDSQQVTGSVPVSIVGETTWAVPGETPPSQAGVVAGTDGTDIWILSVDSSGRLNTNVNGTVTVAGTGTFLTQDTSHANTATTIYSSGIRNASPAPVTQTNLYFRGVTLYLNVTQAPTTSAETLTVNIGMVDPVSNNVCNITKWAATSAANSGFFGSLPLGLAFELYPGVGAVSGSTTVLTQSGVLPYQWQASITHSGSQNWTYSLGAALMI